MISVSVVRMCETFVCRATARCFPLRKKSHQMCLVHETHEKIDYSTLNFFYSHKLVKNRWRRTCFGGVRMFKSSSACNKTCVRHSKLTLKTTIKIPFNQTKMHRAYSQINVDYFFSGNSHFLTPQSVRGDFSSSRQAPFCPAKISGIRYSWRHVVRYFFHRCFKGSSLKFFYVSFNVSFCVLGVREKHDYTMINAFISRRMP